MRLQDYYGRKPLVVALVYYDCPMLCTMTLNGLVSATERDRVRRGQGVRGGDGQLRAARDPQAGRGQKQTYLKRYVRPNAGAGWHFLTGEPADITRLTQAIGFRCAWDAERRQYAHPRRPRRR